MYVCICPMESGDYSHTRRKHCRDWTHTILFSLYFCVCIKVLSSILSLIFESSQPAVLVSAMLGILLSPYAAFQQRKLTETEALRQTVEQFEEEVNYLQVENARLKNQVATMEESVSKLQTLEETVSTLQSLQGNSVTALEQQLQESKNILASMKINTQGQILQNLIGVLLATDVDQNMLLSDAEIQQLISNLEQVENIQLDENLIKSTIIEQGRSVAAVMEIARNVMSNESAMFTYLEKQPPPDGTTTPQNIFSPM